jgi:hypothetical protein
LRYASAAEALGKLLSGEEGSGSVSCRITSMPKRIRYIANGVRYFSVEVTCEGGAQYRIPAYGEEAEGLYSLAVKSLAPKVPYMVAPLRH